MANEDNDDRNYMNNEMPAAGAATQTAPAPAPAAQPQVNLDAAMAALIKAASPAEAARRASAISSPTDLDSLDEPDFGEFDEVEEEVQTVAMAPAEQQPEQEQYSDFMENPPVIQEPVAPYTQAPAPQMQHEPPQRAPEPQMQMQESQPQPQMRMPAEPMPQMQQESAPAPAPAPPPAQPMPNNNGGGQAAAQRGSAPRPGRSGEPLRAPAAPPKVPFSRPAEAAPMMKAPEVQVQQQANNGNRGGDSERYLYEASTFIYNWLMDNQDNDEVLIAAQQWVMKHGTAEHNGVALRGVLEIGDDPQMVLLAVRWLTEHTDHEAAPELVRILASS